MSRQNIGYPFIRNDALAQSMCHSELAECSLTVSSCRYDTESMNGCISLSLCMDACVCQLQWIVMESCE